MCLALKGLYWGGLVDGEYWETLGIGRRTEEGHPYTGTIALGHVAPRPQPFVRWQQLPGSLLSPEHRLSPSA